LEQKYFYKKQFLNPSSQKQPNKTDFGSFRERIIKQLRELNKLELDGYKRRQVEYAANKKIPMLNNHRNRLCACFLFLPTAA
jgi:uncharacterized protein YueI